MRGVSSPRGPGEGVVVGNGWAEWQWAPMVVGASDAGLRLGGGVRNLVGKVMPMSVPGEWGEAGEGIKKLAFG